MRRGRKKEEKNGAARLPLAMSKHFRNGKYHIIHENIEKNGAIYNFLKVDGLLSFKPATYLNSQHNDPIGLYNSMVIK